MEGWLIMDLPLILEKLGYTQSSGAFWGGPCATSSNTYEQLADTWPTGNLPLSGKDVFEATWEIISGDIAADEYKEQRIVSGYAPIADQLDMLYWDVYSGDFGEAAKSSSWFKNCSGVKAEFPK